MYDSYRNGERVVEIWGLGADVEFRFQGLRGYDWGRRKGR